MTCPWCDGTKQAAYITEAGEMKVIACRKPHLPEPKKSDWAIERDADGIPVRMRWVRR